MQSMEWATQARVLHDALLAEAVEHRRARALRAERPRQRPTHPLARHQLTVRHLWWHGAVMRLHRLWSPRPRPQAHHRATARNVG
jgi:hypothetical protein